MTSKRIRSDDQDEEKKASSKMNDETANFLEQPNELEMADEAATRSLLYFQAGTAVNDVNHNLMAVAPLDFLQPATGYATAPGNSNSDHYPNGAYHNGGYGGTYSSV
jgi:hypothetical protein